MPTLFERATQKPLPKKRASRAGMPHIRPLRAFTTYAMHPQNVRFETQETEEEVILFLRQHLILLVPWLILGILMSLVPPVLFPLIAHFIKTPVTLPAGYIIIITLFWYIAVFGFMLTKFLRWYFNVFIVTDERIIDIDFVNLLYKEFSEAKITKVQDISYHTQGLFATFLDYGDVVIQTAGEMPNFIFECVPKPSTVVDVISDVVKKGNGI